MHNIFCCGLLSWHYLKRRLVSELALQMSLKRWTGFDIMLLIPVLRRIPFDERLLLPL
jgi:hypothetical protein